MFKTKKFEELLAYIRTLTSLTIYVHSDVISICTLKIFTIILTKEFVKYEIVFLDNKQKVHTGTPYMYISAHTNIHDDDNIIIYDYGYKCTCVRNQISMLCDMYRVIKSMNLMDEQAMWAFIVGFSFYKIYLYNGISTQSYIETQESETANTYKYDSESSNEHDIQDNEICNDNKTSDTIAQGIHTNTAIENSVSDRIDEKENTRIETNKQAHIHKTENKKQESSTYRQKRTRKTKKDTHNTTVCIGCVSIYNAICTELNNKEQEDTDGIIIEIGLSYPMLKYSSLYYGLKCDMHFITENNLFYKQRKELEDYKINGYLARKGISILKSKEKYNNLDHASVNYILDVCKVSKMVYRKQGHSLRVSSYDCFYLMAYYILCNKNVEAYLLLDKTNVVPSSDELDGVYDMFMCIKQSIATVQKTGNFLIFNLKTNGIKNEYFYCQIAHSIIRIYTDKKFSGYEYVVIVNTDIENELLVYAQNVRLGKDVINGHKTYNKKDFFSKVARRQKK